MNVPSQTIWYPYAQMLGLEIQNDVVRAQGVELHLRDGRTLIDAIASWWCVIHGYNHPELNAALRVQADDWPVAEVSSCLGKARETSVIKR